MYRRPAKKVGKRKTENYAYTAADNYLVAMGALPPKRKKPTQKAKAVSKTVRASKLTAARAKKLKAAEALMAKKALGISVSIKYPWGTVVLGL